MAQSILRPAAERLYAEELAALAAADTHPRPTNWKLSPKMVATFISGSRGAKLPTADKSGEIEISQKFFGDDALSSARWSPSPLSAIFQTPDKARG